MDTILFERDEAFYLVSPIAPFDPAQDELEELAFTKAIRQQAPNEHIGWMRGRYVEADKPNLNGQEWPAHEIEMASISPQFMPVSVMHDPRALVGLIADTRLIKDEGKPPAIDTTLAIWKHRHPEVWEESLANYQAGTLMQSQECRPAYYDCGDCGRRFPKLPGGAEKANWCSHLRGEENAKAARRLGNVTFTGTGLIFGTRGATGALEGAGLDVFQEEVAEFFDKARHAKKPPRRPNHMEISDEKFAELSAKAAEVDALKDRVETAEETAKKVPGLEKTIEETEAAKVKVEGERDDLKTKVEETEEQARANKLAKDRLKGLGVGFVKAQGEFTRGRVEEQAATMTDEEWDARLKELEESSGKKRDDGEAIGDSAGEGEFSLEEVARTGAGTGGGGGAGGGEPTTENGNAQEHQRKSVVRGLVKGPEKSTTSKED